MTDLMEKAIASVRRWPARQQDRLGAQPYPASDEELLAIDEALAQIEAGDYATDAEVEPASRQARRA
ncbi:MAG TPA: hypothetical protein VH913_23555 [Hyphomicrobiaceae bacterium]|jgi:hypothetical protein